MFINLISWLFWKINFLICSSLKYKVINEPSGQTLFAAWHGESYPLYHWAQHRKLCLYPTDNWRGDIIVYLAKKYKYKVIRFTEKGTPLSRSEDLIKIIDILEQGYDLAVAVDGPPKPLVYHKAKPGILLLSQKTNVPIVPVMIRMNKRATFFWRWDKYEIPLPWSEVEIDFGRPFVANEKTTSAELEGSLARLGREARNEE